MPAKSIHKRSKDRTPLSRERVLSCALNIADEEGIGALTIRSLAHELGTKPMSLYYYVANKDEILDGIVDLVFGEIDLPSDRGDWLPEMRRRAGSVRQVLRRHSWAIGLLESRTTPGPATLQHHNATLASLRAGGFSVQQTAHAYALLDSYIYGFALQESALPLSSADSIAEVAEPMVQRFADGDYPHLVEMATEHVLQPGYDFADEFDVGLDVILDALARWIPAQNEELPSSADTSVSSAGNL